MQSVLQQVQHVTDFADIASLDRQRQRGEALSAISNHWLTYFKEAEA